MDHQINNEKDKRKTEEKKNNFLFLTEEMVQIQYMHFCAHR